MGYFGCQKIPLIVVFLRLRLLATISGRKRKKCDLRWFLPHRPVGAFRPLNGKNRQIVEKINVRF